MAVARWHFAERGPVAFQAVAFTADRRLFPRAEKVISSPPSSTHSLRQTKATLIYRRTDNLRSVQLLLGHRKIGSTVRYLGIKVADALAIAKQVDL